MRRARGFTLAELMITLVILGILVGVGVPTFLDATLSSRLGSVANNLVVSAHLARSEAIKRNVTVRLCPSTNGTSCASQSTLEGGWIVIADYPGTTPDVVIQRQAAVSGGIKVFHKDGAGAAVSASVDMPPSGIRAGTTDVFLVCRLTPKVGRFERVVTVSTTGKPTASRTETGACS